MNTVFNSFKKLTLFNKNNQNNKNNKNKNNFSKQTFNSSQLLKKQKTKDTYTIVNYPRNNETYGEFIGSSPKRAAHKAFSKLAKLSNLNNKSEDFLVFSIINKRTNKVYKYIGKRIKLSEPREVIRNGKKIIYKYVNTVGKYKKELNLIN
jgi:hypothetical protein